MTAPTFSNLGASANPDINSSTDATSYSNTSWTPPTSGLLIVFAGSRIASGSPSVPSVSGNGLTWVQIGTSVSGLLRVTLFAANLSGSSSGATTFDYGAETQTGFIASFFYSPDADLSGGVAAAFIQAVAGSGSGTSGSITLSAAGHADNRPISGWWHAANEATTERTNWTEMDDLAGTGPTRGMETQYRGDAFETTASASWATSSNWVGIAAEVKAVVGGGGGLAIPVAMHTYRRRR